MAQRVRTIQGWWIRIPFGRLAASLQRRGQRAYDSVYHLKVSTSLGFIAWPEQFRNATPSLECTVWAEVLHTWIHILPLKTEVSLHGNRSVLQKLKGMWYTTVLAPPFEEKRWKEKKRKAFGALNPLALIHLKKKVYFKAGVNHIAPALFLIYVWIIQKRPRRKTTSWVQATHGGII